MIIVSDYIRQHLINTTGTTFTIPVYNENLPPNSLADFLLVEGNVSDYYAQMNNCTEWDIQVKSQSNVSKDKARLYSVDVLEIFGDIVDLTLTLDSNNIRIIKSKAYANLLYLGEARKNFFQYSNRFRMLIQNTGV